MAEILKNPVNEIPWVQYCNSSGKPMFLVTSRAARDMYYLYEAVDGKWVKRGKEKTPDVLTRKYGVLDKMRGRG